MSHSNAVERCPSVPKVQVQATERGWFMAHGFFGSSPRAAESGIRNPMLEHHKKSRSKYTTLVKNGSQKMLNSACFTSRPHPRHLRSDEPSMRPTQLETAKSPDQIKIYMASCWLPWYRSCWNHLRNTCPPPTPPSGGHATWNPPRSGCWGVKSWKVSVPLTSHPR